jgi:hypothetical protein
MAKITVYHDYIDGKNAPLWYVINFGSAGIDWSKNYVYVPVEAPFQLQRAEDFNDVTLGVSVTIGDITVNSEKPGYFGIHLPSVMKRVENVCKNTGLDFIDIKQFIIQICDLEDVLQMDPIRKHFI